MSRTGTPGFDVLVIGTVNWDVNFFVEKTPKVGEEVVVKHIDRSPGGKGGNVAVASARILGRNKVALVACIGSDETGRRQVLVLKTEGVETSGVRTVEAESGQAFVTVDGEGNNTILTYFGANATMDENQIMGEKAQELLANSNIVVAAGSPKEAVHRVLSEARRLRRTLVWHPGVLARFGVKEWLVDMKDVPYLILNEHEAGALTGKESLADSIAALQKVSPNTRIVVTLGGRGVSYYYQKEHLTIGEVQLGRLGKKVINTTGCGDAFVGTFAAYKSMGLEDEKALSFANMAGALKASRPEVRGSPTRVELEKNHAAYFADAPVHAAQ